MLSGPKLTNVKKLNILPILYPGRNPSNFISENGYRDVVWEKDTAGNSEIYYYCLDIRSPPVNISRTLGKSYFSSIVVGISPYSNGIHIVWTDSSFGPSRIYYRRFDGDTYQISSFAQMKTAPTQRLALLKAGSMFFGSLIHQPPFSPIGSMPAT